MSGPKSESRADRMRSLMVRTVQQEAQLADLRREVQTLRAATRRTKSTNPSPTVPQGRAARPPARPTRRHAGPLLPSFRSGELASPGDGCRLVGGAASPVALSPQGAISRYRQGKWVVDGDAAWDVPDGACVVAWGERVLVHGGHAGDGTLLGDIHVNTSGEWRCLPLKEQEPVAGHAVAVVDDTLYVLCGSVAQGRTNAVRALHLAKRRWVPTESLNPQLIAQRGTSCAMVPAPRTGASCSVRWPTSASVTAGGADSATLVLFGGRLSKFSCASDTFEYNVATNQWSRLYCGGALPSSRMGAATVVHGDTLVIIGGCCVSPGDADAAKELLGDVHCLDLMALVWRTVDVTPLIPRTLGVGAAAAYPSQSGVFFSGGDSWGTLTITAAGAPVTRPVSARPRACVRPPDTRPLSARRPPRDPTKPQPWCVPTAPKVGPRTFGEPSRDAPERKETKRTPKQLAAILQRLAVDDVERQKQRLDMLRLHLMPEAPAARVSEEEEAELVDRMYYDGVEDMDDRRERLEDKWQPHQPFRVYSARRINGIVDRLTKDNVVYDPHRRLPPPRPPSPDTLEAQRRHRAAVAASVERLYTADTETRSRHAAERFDKYAAHPTAVRRLTPREQEQSAERMTSPRRAM